MTIASFASLNKNHIVP